MVLTLIQTLASIDFRVEWAKKHLTELEREIDAFLATEPYKIETRPDSDQPNCSRYYVASVPSEHPTSISLIAGDVLFNLRAALDHLAYQLALANGTTDEKILRQTYFPIFDDAKKFHKDLKARTPGLSQAARDAIKDVKPYKEGNPALWQLHNLNNRDKHRALVTVGSAVGSHSLPVKIKQELIDTLADAHLRGLVSDWNTVMGSHMPSDIVEVNVIPAIRKCPLEKGDELNLAWSDPTIHRNAELSFKFELAFSEPDIIGSQPVIGTLKEIAGVIEGVILSFKPLFI
jgi:hypothetical protein